MSNEIIAQFNRPYEWGKYDCTKLADALIRERSGIHKTKYSDVWVFEEKEALKYAIKNYGSVGKLHKAFITDAGWKVVDHGDILPFDIVWSCEGAIYIDNHEHVLDDNHNGLLCAVGRDYCMYGYARTFKLEPIPIVNLNMVFRCPA